MATVLDVAASILEKMAPQEPGGITTWKLQKLVYYAQAWSLVWDDTPLFADEIQAWANGPVVPALYEQHRGSFKIERLGVGDASRLTDQELETVDAVIEHYGKYTPKYLSDLTHEEAPWNIAREGLGPGERGNRVITLDSLAEYYGGLYASRATEQGAGQQS
jgi:uncharacterized phage-associated protein